MSNKNNKQQKNKKAKNSFAEKYEADAKNSKKKYQNPSSTKAGKVIILILTVAMLFGGLFGLVYLIVQNLLH